MTNCKNCGAPLNFTKEKCEYCETWILHKPAPCLPSAPLGVALQTKARQLPDSYAMCPDTGLFDLFLMTYSNLISTLQGR